MEIQKIHQEWQDKKHLHFEFVALFFHNITQDLHIFLFQSSNQNYTNIGQINLICTRLNQHNNRYGSSLTEPLYLCPFETMAYVCRFDGQRSPNGYIEQ